MSFAAALGEDIDDVLFGGTMFKRSDDGVTKRSDAGSDAVHGVYGDR